LRRRRPRFEKNGVGASSLDVLLCTRGVGNTAPVLGVAARYQIMMEERH
jgi:hypothetical protein